MWRSLNMFQHSVNIERATSVVDVTVIRDRRISTWTTVDYSVPCFFDPQGVGLVESGMFGRLPVARYLVFFEGDRDVRIGDRLKKGATYYAVEDLKKFTDFDHHVEATVREMAVSQNQ